jgi:hypothetical protein
MFVFTAAESHAHLKKHEEFMSSVREGNVIYRTRGEHANHYATDAAKNTLDILSFLYAFTYTMYYHLLNVLHIAFSDRRHKFFMFF